MAVLFADPMTAPNWDDINESGTARASRWTYRSHYSGTPTRWYIVNNRVHCASPGTVTANAVPPSADYAVEADMILRTNQPSQQAGLMIRHDTGDQYYMTYYQDGQLVLAKKVLGVTTVLDTWVQSLAYGGATYRLRLEAVGTAIGAYIDGVLRCSATDASLAGPGLAGLRQAGWGDANIGVNFDNFAVSDDTALSPGKARMIGIVGL